MCALQYDHFKNIHQLLTTMHDIYHPAEDSHLLARFVEQKARGTVLDMGTGSGIQAEIASKKATRVVAVDINRLAIEQLKRKTPLNSNIEVRWSDLWSEVPESFDVIIFNPPYLPADKRTRDLALDGGKKGYEIIARFMKDAASHLKPDGEILLLFSNLTKKEKVDEIIRNSMFESILLGSERMFFEELMVHSLKKSELLKGFEAKGLTGISFLAKGHRGLLFTADYRGMKVTVKIKNPKSTAVGKMMLEAEMLKKVNEASLGPELIDAGQGYIIYRYVGGDTIGKLVKDKNDKLEDIFKEVRRQMEILDRLKINKMEMTNPRKHIIVGPDGKVTLLDFERSRFTERPKNTTQFQEYLDRLKRKENELR
jgi:release factor glutamine methyltransferase